MELGEVRQDCVCACACLMQGGEGQCAQAVWLERGQAAAGPTIENNPPSVDESMHKVSRTNPDGTIDN